jgi:hypothetical protein
MPTFTGQSIIPLSSASPEALSLFDRSPALRRPILGLGIVRWSLGDLDGLEKSVMSSPNTNTAAPMRKIKTAAMRSATSIIGLRPFADSAAGVDWIGGLARHDEAFMHLSVAIVMALVDKWVAIGIARQTSRLNGPHHTCLCRPCFRASARCICMFRLESLEEVENPLGVNGLGEEREVIVHRTWSFGMRQGASVI